MSRGGVVVLKKRLPIALACLSLALLGSRVPQASFVQPLVDGAFTFNPGQVGVPNGFTLFVFNPNTAGFTGLVVTDPFPVGLKIPGSPSPISDCGDTAVAPDGKSFTTSGGNLPPSTPCSIQVPVIASAPGVYTNTVTVQTDQTPPITFSVTLTVNPGVTTQPPVVTLQSSASKVTWGKPFMITVTANNPNATAPVTGVNLSGILQGLTIGKGATSSCGTLIANPLSSTFTLSGITLPGNVSCSTSFNLIGAAPGLGGILVSGTSDQGSIVEVTDAVTIEQLVAPKATDGFARFSYPGSSPATTLFFHDHVLGVTQENVYMGLVGHYLLRQNPSTNSAGTSEIWEMYDFQDSHPMHLHETQFEVIQRLNYSGRVPLVVHAHGAISAQESDGIPEAWNLPVASTNPAGFYNPSFGSDYCQVDRESIGTGRIDTYVNGKTWPFLNVEPRRYRFHICNTEMPVFQLQEGWSPSEPSKLNSDFSEFGGFEQSPTTTARVDTNPQGLFAWHGHFTAHEDEEMMRPITSVDTSKGAVLQEWDINAEPASQSDEPLKLSYVNQNNNDPAFGFGWRHSYDMSFTPLAPGQILITFADGTQRSFNCPIAGPGSCAPLQTGVFHLRVSVLADGSVQVQKTGVDAKVWHLNASGRLDSIGFPTTSLTLTYDASGNLTSVNDTSGRSLQFTSDANGHITSMTDSLVRLFSYAYDAAGNLIQITDPLGNKTQFAYDANHFMTQITDPKGNLALRATYDSQGRVTQLQDALGFTQTFAYAPGVTTITDARGNVTKNMYDGTGRLTAIVDPFGNSTGFSHDANNLLTSLTDARGNTWNFAYDADGNMTGTTDPLGKTASQTFDANDNLLTSTDRLGRTTALTYDANNDVTQAKYADGNSDSFTYASPHQVASWTNANGGVTNYTHNAAGDLTKVTDALGNNSTFSYDAAGRLLQAADPLGHATAIAYNALDHVTSVTDALGDKTQFRYDANQNLISGTDADGNASSYTYDARNALVTGTDPLGGSTAVSYDGNGNVLSETDAAGHATAFTYDALNRPTKSTDPLGDTNLFVYDADGDLTQGTDADGKSTQMTYDALNRPTNVQLADGSNIQLTYDAVGNVLSMTDSRGLNSYTYDARNRLISASTPNGATLGLGRDTVGNTVSTSLPNGQIDHYAYDALNRLQRATDGSGASSTYAYDAASRVTSVALANGTSTTFSYDNADRLTHVVNSFGLKVLSSFDYMFDAVGRRLQVTSGAGGTTKYTYDKDGRLVSWSTPSGQTSTYAYDAVGNRTSLTTPAGVTHYLYDAANRQTGAGAAVLTYDAAGNLLTDGTFAYAYDARNQLVSVTGATVNAQYQYDGLGRRVRQQAGSGVYQYFDDPITGQVLTEAGPDGDLVYFFGSGRISVTGGTSPLYYQYDGTGNVATVTDNLGNVKMNYNYDPWGKFLGAFDLLGTKNKYKFAGEATDPGTGLIYMRGKYYNPRVGRFISGGGVVSPGNLYLYQGSNPVQ